MDFHFLKGKCSACVGERDRVGLQAHYGSDRGEGRGIQKELERAAKILVTSADNMLSGL